MECNIVLHNFWSQVLVILKPDVIGSLKVEVNGERQVQIRIQYYFNETKCEFLNLTHCLSLIKNSLSRDISCDGIFVTITELTGEFALL